MKETAFLMGMASMLPALVCVGYACYKHGQVVTHDRMTKIFREMQAAIAPDTQGDADHK